MKSFGTSIETGQHETLPVEHSGMKEQPNYIKRFWCPLEVS